MRLSGYEAHDTTKRMPLSPSPGPDSSTLITEFFVKVGTETLWFDKTEKNYPKCVRPPSDVKMWVVTVLTFWYMTQLADKLKGE